MFYTGTDGKPYPAVRRVREVDGMRVTTWERDVVNCNILEVEAGTEIEIALMRPSGEDYTEMELTVVLE